MSSVGSSPGAARSKDQYRSHSLPLGSQLNPDWTVSAPAQPAPAPSALDVSVAKHNARV